MTRKKTIAIRTPQYDSYLRSKPKMSKKEPILSVVMIKKSKDKFLTQSQREYYTIN